MTRGSAALHPILVATVGTACLAAMDALMKALAIAMGTFNAVLWRVLVLAVLAAGYFYLRGGASPNRRMVQLHLLRGVILCGVAMLFFWGLARVPLAQAVALSFVAPLIALYLAAAYLQETIERLAIAGSLIGFAGVIVLLAAQWDSDLGPEAHSGALAILASTFLYAWNMVLLRQQAQSARPAEIAFFTSCAMATCLLVAAPFFGDLPQIHLADEILAAGIFSFLAFVLLAWAYSRAEAQHLAPVEYTAFVWAVLLGAIFFGETVSALTLMGAAMIVAGCLLVVLRSPVQSPETVEMK